MKYSLAVAGFFVLVSLGVFAPHTAFASSAAPTFYHLNNYCFSASAGNVPCPGSQIAPGGLDQVQGDTPNYSYIQTYEGYCSTAGYNECGLKAQYRTSCTDYPGGCTTYSGTGYSASTNDSVVSKPSETLSNGYSQWYALVSVSDSLSASDSSITSGQSTLLNWSASRYVNGGCTIDNGVGSVLASTASIPTSAQSGSVWVHPTTTTKYTITCTGASNDGTGDVGIMKYSTTVTVSAAPVNGVCSATHYSCSVGTSGSNVNGSSAYTWTCSGTNGGSTVSCSEAKAASPNVTIYPPPSGYTTADITCVYNASGGTKDCSLVTKNPTFSPTDSLIFQTTDTNTTPYAANNFPDMVQVVTDSSHPDSTTVAKYPAGNPSPAQSLPAYNVDRFQTPQESLPTGTYYFRACANMNTSWAQPMVESNYNDDCSGWFPFTVSGPDLQATAVNFSPAPEVGITSTMTGTVFNAGAVTTGKSFYDAFELNPDSIPTSFANIYATRSYVSPTLAGSATDPNPSAVYRFLSAGTWYVRLCADISASTGVGSVNETNEDNNCGSSQSQNAGWAAFTVAPALAVNSCSASPDPADSNQQVTWSGDVENGVPPYTYSWSGTGGTSSDASFQTSYATAYTKYYTERLSVTDASGAKAIATCDSLQVNAIVCTASDVSLTASPTRVKQGTAPTLTWSVPEVANGVTQCTIRGTDGFSYSIPASLCYVDGNGGNTPANAITKQTTYTLTCGSETAQATVDVLPSFTEF